VAYCMGDVRKETGERFQMVSPKKLTADYCMTLFQKERGKLSAVKKTCERGGGRVQSSVLAGGWQGTIPCKALDVRRVRSYAAN